MLRVRGRGYIAVVPLLLWALALCGGAQGAPTFVHANDPNLPEVAKGVPKGGALEVLGIGLDQVGETNLKLERFDVFAPDATVEVVGGPAVSIPDVAYFRGWATNDPDSVVMLAVPAEGKAHGVITGGAGAWLLQSKPGKAGLYTRKSDLEQELPGKKFQCETSEDVVTVGDLVTPTDADPGYGGVPLPLNVQYTAHMIVDSDYEYWLNFYNASGGNAPAAAASALAYMGDLFAYASSVYEREINTNLVIKHSRLFATSQDPYEDGFCCDAPDGSLYELRAQWDSNPMPRTLVHLLSGKPGGCGCARGLGGLCDTANKGYATSMDIDFDFDVDSPAVLWDSVVVAHEIGHNFNSPHTHDYCNVGGQADPVDRCVDDAANSNCSAGDVPNDLPGLSSLTGGTVGDANGTIMSYCHLFSGGGGMGNIAYTFGLYHPFGILPQRVPDRMLAHVISQGAACMALQYTGSDLRVSKDCKPDEPVPFGSPATCTVTIENLGPDVAQGVRATDAFLSNGIFSFGTLTATMGDAALPDGACSTTANPQDKKGTVTCDIEFIDAGNEVVIEVPILANADGVLPTQNINDRVTVSSDSEDPDPTNNVAEDEVNFVADALDLRVLKDCQPNSPLLAGQEAICTIFVDNLSSNRIADDVKLTDIHTGSGPFEITSVDGTNCTGVGSSNASHQATVSCSFADMNPGERETVTVKLTASEAVTVTDTATVKSDSEDVNPDNDQASDSLTFVASADLSLTKTALGEVQEPGQPGLIFDITAPGQAFPTAPNYGTSPDAVTAGRRIQYWMEVTNTGPSEAKNVVVKDTLPAGVSFYPGSIATGQGSCETQTATLTCSLGNMPFGRTSVIRYEVLVDPAVSAGAVLLNSANVTSEAVDPDTGDNSASTQTVVSTWADMSIIKLSVGENVTGYGTSPPRPILEDLPGQVTAGLDLRYEITVQNNGASDAQNVQVLDLLPGQSDTGLDHDPVTFVNAVGADCQPMDEQQEIGVFGPAGGKFGQVLWCELGAVPAGARKTFHIYTHVDPSVPDGQTLTNGAFVWWGAASPPAQPGPFLPFPFPQIPPELPTTDDPFLDNNFHATDTEVNVKYNLAIEKTSDADVYKPSSTVVYTVTVVNQGPSVVAGTVEVTDTLPDPKQVKYLEDNGDCVWDGDKVLVCELGPMAPNETKAFDIYATVFGSKGEVVNTAELTNGTLYDVYSADNASIRPVRVQGAKSQKAPKAKGPK